MVTAATDSGVTEYLDALREAGGDPVRVDARDAGRDLLAGAAGLLLSGGSDVEPARYGAVPSPLVEAFDAERDAFEIALACEARARGIPTLCICRGLQLANVAFGGTLIADVPAALGERASVRHQVRVGERTERGLIPEHIVQIEPDSALCRIVGGGPIVTGSRHHQAVERCAADLRVVARTGDGVVEAMEARFASPFWLAVQWHPESTVALDDGLSRAIFRAFTSAAAANVATA